MSNVQAATKVADQVISRLFDHRQFTSGEINYLLKELKDGINLEENFNRILKISQNTYVVSDLSSTNPPKSAENMAKDICDKITLLQEQAQRILNLEDEFRLKEKALLSDARAERERVRQSSYRATQVKIEELNETLAREELELERKYLKFEENLRNK